MHGHALFHGNKSYKPLANLIDLRIRLYRRGLQALVRAATDVIFVGVEWATEPVSHDLGLHRMHAVREMLPALESCVSEMREHCLLIADEEDATRREFTAAVREHKQCCVEDAGECRIVDNVLFVDSQDSPGVQCVDLAAYLHHRIDSARDDNQRARRTNQKLYRVLEDCRMRSFVTEGPAVPRGSPGLGPRCTKSRTRRLNGGQCTLQRAIATAILARRPGEDNLPQMHEEPHEAAQRRAMHASTCNRKATIALPS